MKALLLLIISTVVADASSPPLDPSGTCQHRCGSAVVACSADARCRVPFASLLRCQPSDASCQLAVFVEFGQHNPLLDDVLKCFGSIGCTRQYDDVNVLDGIEIEVAEANVTSFSSLRGVWWQVMVTNDLDNSPCTYSNFEFDDTSSRWIDNQTMELPSGKFIVAEPPVSMRLGIWAADYTQVGWQQIEKFTVLSKPVEDFMLVHYCGDDVVLGHYCGEIVFGRHPSSSTLAPWVADRFRSLFRKLSLDSTHGRGYDEMLRPENRNCSSTAFAVPAPSWSDQYAAAFAWPNQFAATFDAQFRFDRGSTWSSRLEYDYDGSQMILRHKRKADGLSCSYLFPPGNGTVLVAGSGLCCADTKVNPLHHPTPPGLFRDQGVYEGTVEHGGVETNVVSVGGRIRYGVSSADGRPIFLQSDDFGGVWNFTSNLDADAVLDFSDFNQNSCHQQCDYVAPIGRRTNHCFFLPSGSTEVVFV